MRLLLAVDGSESSDIAVRTVGERPWPKDVAVRVVSVVQDVYPIDGPLFPVIAELDAPTTVPPIQDAQALVTGVVNRLQDLGLSTEGAVRRGDPRVEVVDEAQRWGADLVVLGSHGRTGITRWLLGSVAEYVLRHAPCSVEVIRKPVTSRAAAKPEP